MLKKIQSCVLVAALGLVTIIGSGCAGGRYGVSPAYYILPGLIGAGVGVVSAVAIGSIYSRQADKQAESQREMMKDQAALQQSQQSAQAATQRCSGQTNLFSETWKECNKHPHSDACLQDQENLDKYCMPPKK